MLENLINNLFKTNKKILVVGDIILDRFIVGETCRLSTEAPKPVLSHTRSFSRLGGAANVCMNIHSVSGKADLMGCIGTDADGDLVRISCATKIYAMIIYSGQTK